MLTVVIFLVPVLAAVSGLYLYQHTGKKEILKFDLVQFVYAFILTPIVYVWLKTFLFAFLVTQLNLKLSVTDIFIADTAFTVIFLYVFAFQVIHSLTKSFELKRLRDPLYDIFQHSEFFHLLTSHVILYVGGVILLGIISTVNALIPMKVSANMLVFYIMLVLGLLAGATIHTWIMLTDDEFDVKFPKFEMFVELVFAVSFIYDIGLYFFLRPGFNMSQGFYWFEFATMGGFVISSLLVERSQTLVKYLRKFHYKSPRLTDPLVQTNKKPKVK
ncbi:MAG: hypothetical protein ACM3IJ_04280 [Candidatus Levyibacteriota bacterium]